jgi:gliding motility associated protien GldN
MKRLFLTSIISLCSLLSIQTLLAQDNLSLRERIARREAQQKKSSTPELSVRAQIMNEQQTQEIGSAPWVREVYRFLDLNKEKNAALYYPVTPTATRMNLFTMIFKQMAEGNITAYKWQLDGSEVFTEDQKVNFKEALEGFEIMYTEENGKYIIENVDIPNNEIRGYYLKEAWYFDKNNSVINIKTLAICPILFRQDDFGEGTTRYPMFWIPYENVRPYASQMPIMTSSLNNAEKQTVNDFFIKHNFEGEIYKTTNMRNLSLAEQFPDEKKRKEEEKKIESQLRAVNEGLWVYNDSIAAKRAEERANAKATKSSGKKGADIKGGSIEKASKKVKQPKSSASRSMRNRKRN